MEKSKKRNILCLMISTAAIFICCLNIYLPSKSSVSVMAKLQIKRTPSAFLKRNVSNESRVKKNDEISSSRIKIEDLKSQILKRINCYDKESHPEQSIQRTSSDTDKNWMNFLSVEGTINSSRNYAVFSVTTDNVNLHDYMFYLPLTTLAWKRIGFHSVILVVGCSNESFSDPLILYVLSRCLELDAVLIYIYSPIVNAVVISQVGRLFAANMLSATFADIDFVYLVTSDADLWPINPDIYRLRSDMAVLSLNSDCCAPFLHYGMKYKMLPMSNIGMRVMTWNKITQKDSFLPKSSLDILNFLYREFGEIALQPVIKDKSQGWYLDQMMISIIMKNWTEQYGSNHVMFIPRNTSVDRIDRSGWKGNSSLDGKFDAYMPLKAFSPDIWKTITPLLSSMHGYNSERYNWSLAYFEGYRKHNPN